MALTEHGQRADSPAAGADKPLAAQPLESAASP
jgi:hypothetical protein